MQRLTHALDAVKATRSRKSKVQLLAALLKGLSKDELPFAARLILGRVLPVGDTRSLGVGWALLSTAAAEVANLPVGVVAAKSRELGDFGDALEVLLPAGDRHLPLLDVPPLIEQIAATNDRGEKSLLLKSLLKHAAPWEARYLVKAILGELRVGVQLGIFEEAVAAAFDVPLDALRRASALTPDPGQLALLAAENKLDRAEIVPGNVVAFMLATPNESVKEPIDPARVIIEDKLDGVRVQAHVVDGKVRLFARGQDEVTSQFPEVVLQLSKLQRTVVLDGEVIAVRSDGGARPFQALQARLNRATPSAAVLSATPVSFIAYDCLFDGEVLLHAPWSERRARLEALGVVINPYARIDATQPLDAQLDVAFSQARSRGNEGLMLKRDDAPYDAGRRGSAWRKVKRAFATLDVVITRAERGHGKRAGVLSDYTFAVWKGAELVEIGKAYSGLTDVEIDAMTKRLEALTTEKLGGYHVVKPEIVIEVAFDGLQPSSRHSSGFALRFPRIARLRDDKKAHEADTLENVQRLFEAQVGSGHREATPQIGLFE
ncbi:MAG: ATP-dependent DNA ligase [Archangium gephyra]|uniref:DNA ligase (ATP) n=1 Tax=Archangium gephyra TaxID=48 RepID=A0A2W5T1R2_9BACT|nr:MAG: ATP-dependent DNA ligase [Archangium gephyra]